MMYEIFDYLSSISNTYGTGFFGNNFGEPFSYIVSFILSSLIFFLPFGMVIKIIKEVFDI